jgi:flotillin
VPDLFDFSGGSVLVVFALIVVIVLLVAYLGSRYKVASVEEALIISGRKVTSGGERRLKVVRGGGVIVYPLLNKVSKLFLTARQINVNLSDAVSRQGIKVSLQGVATVKIGGDEESILNAAERFVGREDQIDSIVKNVLEGSLRSIVGTLTVEELNLDRQKFQQAVQEAAKGDLATSGLTIDNFTIQAIRDEVGYMDLIGQQETARRERDARMAKAIADQEAAVREAEAQQVKLNAQRDVQLRQADVVAQTQAAEAKAAQSGPLAQAEAQQEVTRRQTELAQLEADRKQKELIASTVRPAEADAEAQVKRAEGEKLSRIAAAQAEAERVRLAGQAEAAIQVMKGEAQARVVEVNAEATAKQVTLEGNAEAGITFTKGEAEAKALALKAEAYRQFNDAAVITTVLQNLPEIVRAAAEPIGRIDNLTVLSSEGASDVVKTTTRTLTEASTAVKGLTGIDVPNLLASALGARRGDGEDAPSGPSGGSGGGGGSTGGGRRRGSTPTPPPPAAAGPTMTHAPVSGGGRLEARRSEEPAATSTASPGASIPPPLTTPAPGQARPTTTPAAAPPPAETAEQRFTRAAQAMSRAAQRIPGEDLAGLSSPLPPLPTVSDIRPGDRRPAPGGAVEAAAAAAGVTRETQLDEAAIRLAEELRVIPGIERFGATRLGDLDRSGPRALRTLWRIARDRLDTRYGDMTIGALIDRLDDQGPGGPSA